MNRSILTNIDTDLQGMSSRVLFLVVEADTDDFVPLERALKKVAVTARIFWAQDRFEAIAMLRSFAAQFSTICLIVNVPSRDINGFELVENLKAEDLYNGVKLVFVTGNHDPVLKTRASECGAEAFFIKPIRHSGFFEIAHQLNDLCSSPVGSQSHDLR